MSKPLSVFLVDDHAMVRRGLVSFLGALDDIEVIGEAADGESVLRQFAVMERAGTLPDVVLVDLVMPGMDGMELLAKLARAYPSTLPVVISSFGDSWRVRDALAKGAVGFLMKHASAEQLAQAIRTACRGEVYLDPSAASGLAQSLSAAESPRDELLTDREREVLRLIAQGKSNKEIATQLVISERTARTHVSNVLHKLRFESRTQAAVWALESGIK